MNSKPSISANLVSVRGTELLADDTRERYRQKLARITLDSMVQFVGLLDAKGTVLEINKVALDGVGITLADVEGQPFWTTFWWQVSKEINAELKDSIRRAAQGEFVRWDAEIYGRAGGTETIIIDASLCPVEDEHGNVVFIAAEGRDITQKKAQERLIAQQNEELQALLLRIKELDEIRTQFFANVSHELRTPLALIIGPAERLMKTDPAVTEAERRDTAQVISRNARMLLKHVNDLLDISKLDAGKLKINRFDTDVSGLVRFIASHFEVLASDREITFDVQVPDACVTAIDPEKLQRILMNLLSNAFKFVPDGGRVTCALAAQLNDIVLTVEDSGPGVRPELRKAIFERFRQGETGANRRFAGTGLGLAITHEFVQMHDGRIDVLDSTLGGALFKVAIPAHAILGRKSPADVADRTTLDGLLEELRRPAAVQPAAESVAPATRAKPTVLVVEDNADMNRFVAQCLSREFHVVCAFDGQQGLELAFTHRPTLIVSDIMMPRVSGVEMIAELRARAETVNTPILLLSAKADDELKTRLLAESVQDFVTKPFTEQDLIARARNLVDAKLERDALQSAENTKREAIEAINRQLVARTEQLQELFEQAPSFMAVLRGPEHVFELANAAYYQLIGYRNVVGRSLAEALPELAEQGFRELLDHVLASGEPHVGKGVPVLLQRTPGAALETRFVDFLYQPLAAPEGGTEGIFVEGHDVTDRKHAEDALRRADRRKDEFLATLAHELRNPLGPIRHAAKIGSTSRATDAQLQWSHAVIERQVDHMARLLDDLLDVSRITRGTVDLRTERLELKDSLAAAVEIARPLFEERKHKLGIAIPDGSIEIDADPVRLAQIFSNLLTNAAKYTDPNGSIRIDAKVGTSTVEVAIGDNGIGIAPEVLPNMFEMFSQAKSAIERSEGGLGIGLALVRGLVLLHGGKVEARSGGLGHGSTFVVTLPLAAARDVATSSPASVAGTQSDPKKLRILVADDNRDSADSCAMFLGMLGHDVRTGYSGDEALAIAAQFKPAVALLDIGMPGMTGYDLARSIRSEEWGKDIVLVAVTGWGQADDKLRAENAGFDQHMVKPIDLQALQATLEAMI